MAKTKFDKISAKGVDLGNARIIESELEQLDGITPGTAASSKCAVLDAHKALDVVRTASLRLGVSGSETAVARSGAEINLLVQGVAAGYKVARGERTQVAASDTVVSGLATVIAVIVSPRTRTVKQLFFNASPGDQAGAPAAGSFLITSQKPTAVDDVTPIEATDFTDNIVVDWIAIGT